MLQRHGEVRAVRHAGGRGVPVPGHQQPHRQGRRGEAAVRYPDPSQVQPQFQGWLRLQRHDCSRRSPLIITCWRKFCRIDNGPIVVVASLSLIMLLVFARMIGRCITSSGASFWKLLRLSQLQKTEYY